MSARSKWFVWIAAILALGALAIALFLVLRPGPSGSVRDAEFNPAGAEARGPIYYCPMHPSMVADRPGECPICGMALVRADASRVPVAGAGGDAAVPVAGQAAVHIPTDQQVRIGLKTAPVERRPFVRTIRTVGRVTADETRMHHVHTKVEGWIETLAVNATGEQVRRGQALLSIYSPELVASQEEYLLALRAHRQAADSPLPEVTRGAEELVQSARRRLQLFDMTETQITTIETTGRPDRTLTLFSPISGYVTQRNVTQGEKIDQATTLLDIADLSRVWVLASVYEYEAPFVRAGQQAVVTLSYLPGRVWTGKVTLIYPTVETATRTIQVRLEFANPDLDLKPEMYADVELQGDLGVRLGVPETAILSSGTRHIAFVATGAETFEPREVKIGLQLTDRIEILEGLREGERVVTAANFLIDSESKLKAALEAATAKGRP